MNSEIINSNEHKDVRILPIHEKWEVPSALTGENVFRDKFEQLLTNTENGWLTEKEIFGCTLGFDEALVNAIKYGNKEDENQIVQTTIDISDSELVVTVKDNNDTAFNPDTAFNSVRDDQDKFANHGRGIELMKQLYDEVHYEFMNPGNKVTMIKRNQRK